MTAERDGSVDKGEALSQVQFGLHIDKDTCSHEDFPVH